MLPFRKQKYVSIVVTHPHRIVPPIGQTTIEDGDGIVQTTHAPGGGGSPQLLLQ